MAGVRLRMCESPPSPKAKKGRISIIQCRHGWGAGFYDADAAVGEDLLRVWRDASSALLARRATVWAMRQRPRPEASCLYALHADSGLVLPVPGSGSENSASPQSHGSGSEKDFRNGGTRRISSQPSWTLVDSEGHRRRPGRYLARTLWRAICETEANRKRTVR